LPAFRPLPKVTLEQAVKSGVFFGFIDLKQVNPNKHIEGIIVLWVPGKGRIIIGVTNVTDNTSEIYISDDYGKSWVLKYTDAYAGNRYRCAFISRKGTIFMGGETYSARSTDNGDTWERMTDPNIAPFTLMNFTEDKEGNVYACQHGKKILKSSDEGVTWTEVYDVTAEDDHLHGCEYDRYRDKFWIATGDTNYKLIRLSNTFVKEAEWTITINDYLMSYFAPIVTEEALFWATDAGGRAYITKAKTDMAKWYHIVAPTHGEFAATNNIWYRGIFGEFLTFWGRDYQYFLFTNDMGETLRHFSVGASKTIRWACDAGNHILIICEDVLVSIPKESLRGMPIENMQIILFDYEVVAATTWSMKVPVRKFNTIRVYVKVEDVTAPNIPRLLYPFNVEYFADTAITTDVTEQVVDWANAKGMDFVAVGLYASTFKQLVALLLIA